MNKHFLFPLSTEHSSRIRTGLGCPDPQFRDSSGNWGLRGSHCQRQAGKQGDLQRERESLVLDQLPAVTCLCLFHYLNENKNAMLKNCTSQSKSCPFLLEVSILLCLVGTEKGKKKDQISFQDFFFVPPTNPPACCASHPLIQTLCFFLVFRMKRTLDLK